MCSLFSDCNSAAELCFHFASSQLVLEQDSDKVLAYGDYWERTEAEVEAAAAELGPAVGRKLVQEVERDRRSGVVALEGRRETRVHPPRAAWCRLLLVSASSEPRVGAGAAGRRALRLHLLHQAGSWLQPGAD